MSIEPITFQKADDGRIAVLGDHWPEWVEFSLELLDTGAPTICADDEGYIQVNVSNGCARYVITDRRPGNGVVEPVKEIITARLMTGRVAP